MAILTVGAGKTYSTIAAAYTAATAGDTIEVYQSNLLGSVPYLLDFDIDKNIIIVGMDAIVCRLSRINVVTANASMENICFWCDFNRQYYFNITTAVDVTIKNCRTSFSQSNHLLRVNHAGAVATVYNCVFQYIYSVGVFLYNLGGTLNVYNNVFQFDGDLENYGIYSSGTTNVYNNIIIYAGGEPVRLGGGVINYDYNISTIAQTSGNVGSNNVVVSDLVSSGLVRFYNNNASSINDLRTIRSYEVAGTTNANGVDLTTLFTTDIDGRTRTTYARGCSEGFDLYVAPDYPAIIDVRKDVVYENGTLTGTAYIPSANDVRNGVSVDNTIGNLVIPSGSQVQNGVFFESSGSIQGTYDNSTNSSGVIKSYGGLWNDDYLSDQLDFINNVKVGASGGISWSGGYVAACQDPTAPQNVSLNARPSAPNIIGIS